MRPKQQSPLFASVLWKGDHFLILDETLLPSKMEYITVTEVGEALQAVKEMKTRAFGQILAFLYSVALVARGNHAKGREWFKERLTELAEEFTRARPTFDFNRFGQFILERMGELTSTEETGGWIEGKTHELVAQILRAREERAFRAAQLLPNPCRLLTHCNLSGELVAIGQYCQDMGKEVEFFATETRPYLQGSRLTAWELAYAGLKVNLIPDCAIAQIMANGKVNVVLVGSDRSAQNGDIINKVGTYPIALMAREYRIPFYVLVHDPRSLATGDDVPIEERPVSEILTFQGRSLAPPGIQDHYPAFDLTPSSLISLLIGFDGTFTPESFRQRFQKRPSPAHRREKEKEKFLLLYGPAQSSSYSHLSSSLKLEGADAVLVPEMRPELWGALGVARGLLERNIPTTLISDNMMGTFFARGQVRHLYLFWAELTEKGPLGICGSLLAVLLSRAHGVPVELLDSGGTSQAPLDRDVSTFLGQRVCPDGVSCFPIERELVPWTLFKEKKADIA